MRAGLLLLLAVVLSAAAAAPAHAGLVTRPHAKKPLSDRRAAKLVHRSRFEPRPANHAATHAMPTAAQLRAFRAQSEMPYARYVTGHFTGTTDEVIQWAARKWGLKPDLLRAVGTVESWWRMSTVGDNGDSFGLFQVRRPFHCTEPVCEQFRDDAALNADYYGGILRSYYDGKQRWLNTVSAENGKPYRRGDLWASVGAWFSGRWWNAAARGYVREVKRRLKARTWRTRDVPRGLSGAIICAYERLRGMACGPGAGPSRLRSARSSSPSRSRIRSSRTTGGRQAPACGRCARC